MPRTVLLRVVLVMFVAVLGGACSSPSEPRDGTDLPDGVCGGIQGLPCDDGQFCELEPGSCQSADLQGVCVQIPDFCAQVYEPVCGCDGKTYGNDCMRQAAAVQKDHDGEC